MNHRVENNPLLDDVLAETVPPDLRADLLGETLRVARQRRLARRARRAAVLAVSAIVFGGAVQWFTPERSNPEATLALPPARSPSYSTIRTLPLPARALIATQPLPSSAVIASARVAGIVQTRFGNGYRIINDEELLALAAPRQAALVRIGPHAQELIFLSPTVPQN